MMLRFSILLIVIFFLSIKETKAGTDKGVVKISGKVKTDQDSIKLTVGFWKKILTDAGGINESKEFRVKVNTAGEFSLELPVIDQPARISIYDIFSRNFLCDHQIVEPGDSIFIDGTIQNKEEPYYFKARFSGKGSAKFNCSQEINNIQKGNDINLEQELQRRLILYDSVLKLQLGILEKFKKYMSNDIWLLLKTDIVGYMNKQFISGIAFPYRKSTITEEVLSKRKALFEKFSSSATPPARNEILSQSHVYTQYVYQQALQALAYEKDNLDSVSFKDLYMRLRDEQKGEFKDKLLTYSLYSIDYTWSRYGVDNEELNTCLSDAINTIRTPWLKEFVNRFSRIRGKGAVAFDFTLPMDSSGRKLSLSELKGKVVLLDMWSYICTGCSAFSQAFHEKVYPYFKDNRDFAVVSIMLGNFPKHPNYMNRLRSVNTEGLARFSIYTYPDYINLFGGKGEENGRMLENHYYITSYPFILLIDKKGKIFSSSIPFPYDDTTAEKLRALINQALEN